MSPKLEPGTGPAVSKLRPVVVTGGAGFIGCNLAHRLVQDGEHVVVVDTLVRQGVEENLAWLFASCGSKVSFRKADVSHADAMNEIIAEAAGVFHLAAQVAVTSSVADPRTDFTSNLTGTFNILEAARHSRHRPPVVFASTNKVYGTLDAIALRKEDSRYRPIDDAIAHQGICERHPLSLQTPYGCSKGAADQYVLDAANTFGLPTVVFRMSCIYGPHQCGTEDQGWVAHFAQRLLNRDTIHIYGDGCQVRDVLHVDDVVETYVRAFREIGKVSGRAFNLGGGVENAVSLLEVIDHMATLIQVRPSVEYQDWRPGDQRYYVSDRRAVDDALGLSAPRGWRDGIAHLVSWSAARVDRRSPPSTYRVPAQAHP